MAKRETCIFSFFFHIALDRENAYNSAKNLYSISMNIRYCFKIFLSLL